MKCPFCGEKLYDDDSDVQLFACYGSSCENSICKKEYAGTKELWQELITTRKALDVAIEGLKEIQDKGEYVNPIELAESYLDEITALKQKEQQ